MWKESSATTKRLTKMTGMTIMIVRITRNAEFFMTALVTLTVVISDEGFLADEREEVDQKASSLGDAEQDDGAEKAEEVGVVVSADAGVQEAAVVVETLYAVVADSW
jgi:hypothetical protein